MKTFITLVLLLIVVKLVWKVGKKLVKWVLGLGLVVVLGMGMFERFQSDPDVIEWKETNYSGMSDVQIMSSVKDSTIVVVKELSSVIEESMSSQLDSTYKYMKEGFLK